MGCPSYRLPFAASGRLLPCLLVLAFAAAYCAKNAAAQPTTDTMAHRILDAALQSNALSAADAAPWYLRAEFRIHSPGAPHPIFGSFEEWFAAPGQWRRTYSSAETGLNGTEWSTDRRHRYLARRGARSFDHIRLDLRIAHPLVDPLQRAALIRPDDPMQMKIISAGGLTLNCISVIHPPHETVAPYPTMCFDRDNHLRLLSTLSAAVEFDRFESFRHRAVARSVKILVNGALFAEIDVTMLNTLPAGETHLLEPPRNAIPEPILLEPGSAAPISLYEIAAHPQLQPDGFPYRGQVLAPVVIAQDGRADLDRSLSIAPGLTVLDSIEIAVHRWRFKPYLVDGQPTAVALIVRYKLDGRPFAPLFQQPHAINALDLEDYLEAGGVSTSAPTGGAPRGRRGRR